MGLEGAARRTRRRCTSPAPARRAQPSRPPSAALSALWHDRDLIGEILARAARRDPFAAMLTCGVSRAFRESYKGRPELLGAALAATAQSATWNQLARLHATLATDPRCGDAGARYVKTLMPAVALRPACGRSDSGLYRELIARLPSVERLALPPDFALRGANRAAVLQLEALTSLTVGAGVCGEEVEALAAAPALRRLSLSGTWLPLSAIAAAARLSGLTSLALAHRRNAGPDVADWAQLLCGTATRLQQLTLVMPGSQLGLWDDLATLTGLTSLHLTGLSAVPPDLAPLAALARLRVLRLVQLLPPPSSPPPPPPPALGSLSCLAVKNCPGLRGAAWPQGGLPRVQALTLAAADLAADALAQLTSLTYLDLADQPLGEAHHAALRGLTGLRELHLRHVAGDGPRLFGGLAGLPALGALVLRRADGGHGFTPAAARALAQLRGLTRLSIGLGPMPWALRPLSQIDRLRALELHGGQSLRDADLTPLAALTALTALRLHGATALTDAALGRLAPLGRLEALRLVARPPVLTPACLAHLTPLTQLTSLRLALTEAPAPALAPVGRLRHLRELVLDLGVACDTGPAWKAAVSCHLAVPVYVAFHVARRGQSLY